MIDYKGRMRSSLEEYSGGRLRKEKGFPWPLITATEKPSREVENSWKVSVDFGKRV